MPGGRVERFFAQRKPARAASPCIAATASQRVPYRQPMERAIGNGRFDPSRPPFPGPHSAACWRRAAMRQRPEWCSRAASARSGATPPRPAERGRKQRRVDTFRRRGVRGAQESPSGGLVHCARDRLAADGSRDDTPATRSGLPLCGLWRHTASGGACARGRVFARRRACSSVGQSGPLITAWSQVRVLPGASRHGQTYRASAAEASPPLTFPRARSFYRRSASARRSVQRGREGCSSIG